MKRERKRPTKRDPTEMEIRVARAVFESLRDYTVDVLEKWEDASCEDRWQALFTARAAIRAMKPDIDKMDGSVMNAMCEAFEWPEGAGSFPGHDGLTSACTRAVNAYIDSASPPDPAHPKG